MTTTSFLTQVPIKTGANAISKIVTTSSGSVGILDTVNRVYTLGNASNGEMGDGTTVNKSTPTLISGFASEITAFESGYANFGAVANNNQTLYTWGNNSGYQLGDGTTTNKSSPVAIAIAKTAEYPWKSITQGSTHFAAIRTTDGALFTWGNNAGGQLGDGTTIAKSQPIQIGNKSWSMVSAGISYTTAIDSIGVLYTWGNNAGYQLGDGTTINKSSPVLISSGSSWTTVCAGDSHTTAIDILGNLWAWGLNTSGQVGYLTGSASYSTPIKIPSLGTTFSWRQLVANADGTLTAGITTVGALYTWGNNNVGQLGDGTTINKSQPIKIGSSSWSAVSAGNSHVIAIDTNGSLYTWGLNTSSQLGDGTTIAKSLPAKISSGNITSTFSANTVLLNGTSQSLSAPSNSAFAFGTGDFTLEAYIYPTSVAVQSIIDTRNADSTVIGIFFGLLSSNQLSVYLNATVYASGSTVPINVWSHVAAVRSGNFLTLYLNGISVLTLNISSYNFSNAYCQIGASTGVPSSSANYFNGYMSAIRIVKGTAVYTNNFVPPTANLTAIANTVLLTAQSATIIDNSTNAFTITNNGTATVVTQNILATLPNFSSWSAVSAGASHTTAIDTLGNLYAWGSNATGQVGYGSLLSTYSTPQKIQTETLSPSWKQLVANEDGTLTVGITTTGALYTWGLGTSGQLGDNTIVSKSSPVKIGSSSWSTVSAGNSHIVAIDVTGALYAWGLGTSGQLGDGTIVTKSSPVKIGTSSWTSVSAGASHTTAIDINGNLYAWGSNATGQVGYPTTQSAYSSPVKFPLYLTNGSWRTVSTDKNLNAALAIDTMGRLWGWGFNTYGQLGDGTIISRSSPVQIGTSSWSVVSTGTSHTAAITVDGSLYTWGQGAGLALGNGNVARSSPVKVGTSSWTTVSAGVDFTMAIDITGALYAWGTASAGSANLGDGTTISKSSPVKIGSNSWTTVNAGWYHTAAIDVTGALYTWGSGNHNGVLGDGTTVNKSSPVQIGTSSWAMVNVGASASSAIDINGRLFTWGLGNVGQLGNSASTNRSSPVQVGTSSWSIVSAGSTGEGMHGITSNGRLFWWGAYYTANGGGTTGTTSISSPVQIGTGTSFTFVSSGGNFTGGYFAGAISSAGSLYTWGTLNSNGQLGNNSTTGNALPPAQIMANTLIVREDLVTFSSWTSVSSGISHNAAITTTGTLIAWGGNTTGQLGDGTTVNKPTGVQIGPSSWSSVSAGASHTTGVLNTGALFAWGGNATGQLGDGTTINKSSPVVVTLFEPSTWKQISSYGDAGGVIAGIKNSDSSLWTWGYSAQGNLGDGTTIAKSSPVKIGSSSWSMVSVGNSHAMAIDITGALYGWGYNQTYQLGDGTTISKSSPVKIGSRSWTSVSAGGQHTVGITTDGGLYTWGYNFSGQIGNGSTTDRINTLSQIGTSSWASVSAGSIHTAAIDINGNLFVWGNNDSGQIGDSTVTRRSSPVKIGSLSWTSVSGGGVHTIAIDTTGALYAWGLGTSGQLGDGTTINKSSPVKIGSLSWSKISAGSYHNAAIDTTGALWSWGDNNLTGLGKIGDGTTVNKSTPVKIGTSSWSSVSAGYMATAGITNTNTLFTWGTNTTGQLGDGTTINKSTPVVVYFPNDATIKSFVSVSAGMSHSIGVDTLGSLWLWGGNATGQLGDGRTVNRSVPFLVARNSDSSWRFISAGGSHTAAITTANTAYIWGLGTSGQLGDRTVVSKSSPVLVSAFNPDINIYSSWSTISAGASHTTGIISGGSLYAWGANADGRLGDGTTITKSSPVQVGLLSPTGFATIFNGTNGITAPSTGTNAIYSFGTSPFTVEGWYYFVPPGTGTLFQMGTETTGRYVFYFNGAYTLGSSIFGTGTNNIVAFSPYTWYHIAVVRVTGGAVTVYVNGVATGFVDSRNQTVGNGAMVNVGSFTGALSNFRVLNGTALYTANFTPPAQVTSITNTVLLTCNSGTIVDNSGSNITIATAGSQSPIVTTSFTPFTTTSSNIFSWTAVNAGGAHTLALTTTGNLYGWGSNANGQLGTNTFFNVSTPVQTTTAGTLFPWRKISYGDSHAVAISSTGALYTWGNNPSGQLGDGTTIAKSSPIKIGISSWSIVAAGMLQTAGITTDGALWTWGSNVNGELGSGTTINRSSPVQIGTRSWTFISVGGSSMAAIDTTGALYTWGTGANGAIGDGTAVAKSSPVKIGSSSWTTISVGGQNMAGLTLTGALFTWGYNVNGALGNNISTATNQSAPLQVGTSSWTIVVANQNQGHCAAIDINGRLFTWGYNGNGMLGTNNLTYTSSPVQVSSSSSWSAVGVGLYHTMAITTGGSLFAWGYNAAGQLGLNNTTQYSAPQQVGNNSWSILPSTLGQGTLALDTTGSLFAWGNNNAGQLGDNTVANKSSPVFVMAINPLTVSWTSVSSGASHSVGIDTTGSLYTWGGNSTGQLGDGTTLNKSTAVKYGVYSNPATSSWTRASAGGSHTVALTTNNNLYTWGLNTSGQLGDGTTINKSFVAAINLYDESLNVYNYSWSIVSAGYGYTTAIQSTGALWAWGGNAAGQVGKGTTINQMSPVQLGTSSWTSVSAGNNHTIAISTNSNLYAWGNNASGQIGDGTTINKVSPILISSSWTYAKADYVNSTGIKNGSAYIWGDNVLGQLGDGSTINKSVPTILSNSRTFTSWRTLTAGNQYTIGINASDNSLWTWGVNNLGILGDGTINTKLVPDILLGRSWSVVNAGWSNAVAIDTTGALWTWGDNTYGQIGDGTTVYKSSPVQIGTRSWSKVSSGSSNTAAIDTTGALYMWGYNVNGGLGDSTTVNKSSPVKIGTSSWSVVSAGGTYTLAITIAGAFFAWGNNGNGQLGLGISTATNTSSPQQVGSSSWSVVAATQNGAFSSGIDTAGKLYTWGYNGQGQLGLNTASFFSAPQQVSAGTSWSVVSVGSSHMAAITTTGALFAWGGSSLGQVGNTGIGNYSGPNQIGTNSWTIVSAGQFHTVAQDISGSAYGWGQGSFGNGSAVNISSPVLVNTLTNIKNAKAPGWKGFSIASGTIYGLTLGDSLFAWGANTANKFAFNDYGSRSTPDIVNIRVSNLSISDVAIGNNTMIAVTTDNETNSYLHAWGNNAVGQYGDGTTVTRSSPVLVTQLATGYTANLFFGGSGSNFRR